jgi:hypothetical protein
MIKHWGYLICLDRTVIITPDRIDRGRSLVPSCHRADLAGDICPGAPAWSVPRAPPAVHHPARSRDTPASDSASRTVTRKSPDHSLGAGNDRDPFRFAHYRATGTAAFDGGGRPPTGPARGPLSE